MAQTIRQLVREMQDLREEIEQGPISAQADKLERIFNRAERDLKKELQRFESLTRTPDGHLVRSAANVQRATDIAREAHDDIDRILVEPGREWGIEMIPAMREHGESLARANLDVPWISQDMIDEVFAHVPRGVPGVLEVGRDDTYRIMNMVGDDVQTWFRREMLDAIIEGIPVQGRGSLAERLFTSNRIRPLQIRSKTGRIIYRSIRTRANAIARVESAKIVQGVHENIARRALGNDAVYLNTNPLDSRTTVICERASKVEPMTLQEWSRSRFGRPPRLDPFHLCRSTLIGVRPEWLD